MNRHSIARALFSLSFSFTLKFFRQPQLSALILALLLGCGLLPLQLVAEEPEPLTVLINGATFPDREQSLAASVSVVEEYEYRERGAQHFSEVLDLVPNLNFAGGSSRPRFFQIRGIGELEQYEGAPNPSVGVFIDGFDLSGIASPASLFDITQVEVLRGPQGVRFGPNALAGAINLRSQEPTGQPSALLFAEAGSYDSFAFGLATGGPVGASESPLRYRLALQGSQSDGFYDNQFLERENTNGREELTGRGRLAWQVPGLRAELKFIYLSQNNGYDAFTIDNSYATQSDKPGADDQKVRGSSFEVEGQLGRDVTAISTTSFLRSDSDYSYDGDWGNNQFWGEFAPYDYFYDSTRLRDTLSQELRLLRTPQDYRLGRDRRSTLGVYWQRLEEDTHIEQSADNFVYDELLSTYNLNTLAFFGQHEEPVAKDTSVSAGVRTDLRNLEYRDSRQYEDSPDESMLGGSVSLQHQLTPAMLTYVSANRGYKGGGFNVSAGLPAELRRFEAEYLWSFELGSKGSLHALALDYSLTFFHALRRDQQIRSAIQLDPEDPLTFNYVSRNAARGWNQGIEAELLFHASERWEWFLNGSLLDTKLTSVPGELEQLRYREQSHAPGWQYVLGSRYSFEGGFFVRADVSGKDAFYFDDSHDQRSQPYHLVNAALGWSEGPYSVLLWARNIFDKHYAVRGFYFGVEPPDYPAREYVQLGERAQLGLSLRYQF
jgi:iron complex outermembrane receptor protein